MKHDRHACNMSNAIHTNACRRHLRDVGVSQDRVVKAMGEHVSDVGLDERSGEVAVDYIKIVTKKRLI